MDSVYAVLPCNGLDKRVGSVTREVALLLSERNGSRIICPVFLRMAQAKYIATAGELPLLVIDGCAARCASKLAAEMNIKISRKITIAEEAKIAGIELPGGLRLGEPERCFASRIADELIRAPMKLTTAGQSNVLFPPTLNYDSYRKDKFVFRVPNDDGFFFNENDVWAYVSGNKARIGVTDYVQKSLSDIVFFTPPPVGTVLEQFDGAGEVESGKAVFEVISPVSGTITAVNERLADNPGLINENPYEQGWIAELDLSGFESDRVWLLEFDAYFPILQRKAGEYHVKN